MRTSLLTQNTMFCVFFALSLLAGAVTNSIYTSSSHRLSPDICDTAFHNFNSFELEVCDDIRMIPLFEGILAVRR